MTVPTATEAPSTNGVPVQPIPIADTPMQAVMSDALANGEASSRTSAPIPPAVGSPAISSAPAPDLTPAWYVRLALGALLETVSFLEKQMREAAAGDVNEVIGADDGLIEETIETVKEACLTAGTLAMSAVSTGQKLVRPIYGTRLFSPTRGLTDQLLQQTHEARKQFRQVSRTEAERSRRLARAVFGSSVGEVTGFLGQNQAVDELLHRKVSEIVPSLAELPTIDGLLQDLVGRYLAFLKEHPEQVEPLVREIANGYIAYLDQHPDLVDKLIQQRGDRYLDYLHDENPEAVQELIQGQSLGLVDEVMDQVRERTVTADSLLEATLRAILRRTPREKMPEPPEVVMKQASPTRLPYRPRPRGAGEQE